MKRVEDGYLSGGKKGTTARTNDNNDNRGSNYPARIMNHCENFA